MIKIECEESATNQKFTLLKELELLRLGEFFKKQFDLEVQTAQQSHSTKIHFTRKSCANLLNLKSISFMQ